MKSTSHAITKTFTGILAIVGIWSSGAMSGTTPYTLALVSTYNPTESVTSKDTHDSPATGSIASYSQSGDWGSVSGFASADLATGELKVAASNNPLEGAYPYMQTNAWFGDGFRTTSSDGGAFAWQPNSVAQFTLDLKGSVVSASDPQLANVGFGVGGFVMLSLFQPGTLTPASKLVGDANSIGSYLFLLGNPNQTLYYIDPQGELHQLTSSGYYDLSQDVHISQTFQPNGDLDWVALLGTSGQVTSPDFYNLDLSHTLTVGYQGPTGTTTSSVSGLFNNFQDGATVVPEPSSALLVGIAGFLTLIARAARTRANTSRS